MTTSTSNSTVSGSDSTFANTTSVSGADHQLDTTGLICPEPVMLLHRVMRKAKAGETIEVLATDPATSRDIPNFCRHLGHTLLNEEILTSDAVSDNSSLTNTDVEVDVDTESTGTATKTQITHYRYLLQKKQL